MTAKKPNHSRWSKLLTEEEVEVVEILLNLPKLCRKSELVNRYSFTWGSKKKRSVLDPLLESSSPAPEADHKTPSTTLSLDGDRRKPPLAAGTVVKRKTTDDMMETNNRRQQAMEAQHQQLTFINLEHKVIKGKKTSYSMKTVDEQQQEQHIAMFVPPTPQYHCLPQLVDPDNDNDNDNDKLVGVMSSFGLSNHRVTYDFMGLSQPLDQSDQCLVMDDDSRARNAAAAAARKKRMLRLKENRNSNLVAMKRNIKKL